jgi:hypothetical protein
MSSSRLVKVDLPVDFLREYKDINSIRLRELLYKSIDKVVSDGKLDLSIIDISNLVNVGNINLTTSFSFVLSDEYMEKLKYISNFLQLFTRNKLASILIVNEIQESKNQYTK